MGQRPDLPPHVVDLWYAYVSDLIASDSVENHYKILSCPERERIEQFALPRVRDESLAARLLVRRVLSFYANIPPQNWQFGQKMRGKPFVEAPWEGFDAFNLAHSANLVVCAVAAEGQVGVDVESLDRMTTGLPLARRFFASAEVEQLMELPAALRREAFLQIWTLKEAYIKAIGDGMALPLDQFFFDLSATAPARLHLSGKQERLATEWLFAQCRLASRHHISLGVTNDAIAGEKEKSRVVIRARELKSLSSPIPDAFTVCSQKNGWFFVADSK